MCRLRLRETTVCPRCGTDLTWSLSITEKAEQALRNALCLMLRRDIVAARLAAEQARSLRRTPLNQVLPGFVEYLLKRESTFAESLAESKECERKEITYSKLDTNDPPME